MKKPKKQKEKGHRGTVWIPSSLDPKVEETRAKLGLGLSAFIRFAIVETIKDMKIKENQE